MKQQPKLTPWFNIAAFGQPVRKGRYEVRYNPRDTRPDMRYWNGSMWLTSRDGSEAMFGNDIADHKQESWRGLASDPKAAA